MYLTKQINKWCESQFSSLTVLLKNIQNKVLHSALFTVLQLSFLRIFTNINLPKRFKMFLSMHLWSSLFSDSLGLLKATLHRRKKLPRHKELLPIRSKKKTTYMHARRLKRSLEVIDEISESYMQHGCAGETLSNISYFRWVAGV